MEHPRRSQAEQRATHARDYPYVSGNFPDLDSLSSYAPTQTSRDGSEYEANGRDSFDGESHNGPSRSLAPMRYLQARHRGTAGTPPGSYGADRNPEIPATRAPTGRGEQSSARRRYRDGPYPAACIIGEAIGNKNKEQLDDQAHVELLFVGDPALCLVQGPPQPPADVDGLFIGRFVGNLNSGRIGGSAKLTMRFEPRRAPAIDDPHASLEGSLNDSRRQGQSSRYGLTVYASQTTETASSTFTVNGRERSLGPPAGRYAERGRR
ncbi:hypothetical protein BKA70DRAFT_49425 [Coprinopsis sp. MPI-PUGE-AT-0042]|nr:hypothetical protein BKA70DRAFT_49425 [Coprinopsis sp. MPI-PUGE-AT-0042]